MISIRVFSLLLLFQVVNASGSFAKDEFDMELDELRKEVHAMNTIVEPVFNSTVHQYIKYYLNSNATYTREMLERSALYFPLIENELSRAGLPLELKYLVVIESAVKPDVRSRVGATGLWQLMVPTARHFGLRVNYMVDERLDPNRSTRAAVLYLQELYDQFNDWSLVMAAYNCGPSRVKRASDLAGSSNYWDLARYLPRETRKYVPKFIAAQYAFSKFLQNHLEDIKVSLDLVFTTDIRLSSAVSLQEVSEVTGIELVILQTLNTSWKRLKVGDENGNYELRLPDRVVDIWLQYEAINEGGDNYRSNAAEKDLWDDYLSIKYTVKEGESIEEIAQKFGINPFWIKGWNNLYGQNSLEEKRHIHVFLPKNDACAYIGEVIKLSENLTTLSSNGLKSLESNNPVQIEPVQTLSPYMIKEEEEPVIIPRGMSYIEYKQAQ